MLSAQSWVGVPRKTDQDNATVFAYIFMTCIRTLASITVRNIKCTLKM